MALPDDVHVRVKELFDSALASTEVVILAAVKDPGEEVFSLSVSSTTCGSASFLMAALPQLLEATKEILMGTLGKELKATLAGESSADALKAQLRRVANGGRDPGPAVAGPEEAQP